MSKKSKSPNKKTKPKSTAVNFNADRPIERQQQDRLGFHIIAKQLASSVLSASSREGFVIGIEGQWGSGKSSVLNLLCSYINKDQATVIRFDPWIIGDRNSLVSALMGELAIAIRAIGGTTSKDAANSLLKYGSQLGKGVSRILGGAAAVVPLAGLAQAAVDAATSAAEKWTDKPLAELKKEITKGLLKLDHRIIVVIDDLDRLEPQEVAEIVRLVRAVGDFPNVIYLLCYDRKVLAHSIKTAISVKSGKEYLKKIIQVSFPIPKPEDFDLRRWLLEECRDLYQLVTGKQLEQEEMNRLAMVCDIEGGNLQTPRDVTQVINALRLTFPPVAENVDFPDMCWLQLVRISQERLYKTVEEYLGILSIVKHGIGAWNDIERKRLAKNFTDCLPDKSSLSSKSIWRLKDIVPGITARMKDQKRTTIFTDVSTSEIGALEKAKRLGSPSHYRFYFAFSAPAEALSDDSIDQVIHHASQGKDVEPLFRKLLKVKRPQGGTKYEVLIDRLSRANLPQQTALPLLTAIGNTIDEALKAEPEKHYGRQQTGTRAANILKLFLQSATVKQRNAILSKLFSETNSIGWLLEEIIGHELFAQERGNLKRSSMSNPILSEKELDSIIDITLARLKTADRGKIKYVPNSLSFLWRWKQTPNSDADLKKWVSEETVSDAGFLHVMNMCRSWSMSDKVYHPLNRRDVSMLMDFDKAVARLKKIATKKSKNGKTAQELLDAVAQGKDYGEM